MNHFIRKSFSERACGFFTHHKLVGQRAFDPEQRQTAVKTDKLREQAEKGRGRGQRTFERSGRETNTLTYCEGRCRAASELAKENIQNLQEDKN